MKKNIYNPILIICSTLLILVAWDVTSNVYDNDLWWILATGREISESGIPYINPWSMHEGLSIVVQQWLSAFIMFKIYSLLGMLGIRIFVFLQIIILFSIFLILFKVSSDNSFNPIVSELIILILFISISEYTRSRPQLWSMISYSTILILLEKYRRTNNIKEIVFIPLIVLVHTNLHISMAPFDLFLIGLYCLPTLNIKNINIQYKYAYFKRFPLWIVLFISCGSMLLNPYGIEGALYLFKSYGVADYANYISEMSPTVLWSKYGISVLFSIICGFIIIGYNGIKKFDFPITLLFCVCTILSIQHIRNIWLLPIFSVPLLANGFSHIKFDLCKFNILNKKLFNIFVSLACLLILISYIYPDIHQMPIVNESDDDANVPVLAINYLENYSKTYNIDKKELKIYNSFNIGGILEWYGFKVFMDPRPELWEPGITGVNEHYYYEFIDFSLGISEPNELIDKYNFDFLIAYDNNSSLDYYLDNSNEYHIVVYGNGYNLWEKNKL